MLPTGSGPGEEAVVHGPTGPQLWVWGPAWLNHHKLSFQGDTYFQRVSKGGCLVSAFSCFLSVFFFFFFFLMLIHSYVSKVKAVWKVTLGPPCLPLAPRLPYTS